MRFRAICCQFGLPQWELAMAGNTPGYEYRKQCKFAILSVIGLDTIFWFARYWRHWKNMLPGWSMDSYGKSRRYNKSGGYRSRALVATNGPKLYFMRGTTIMVSDIINGEFSNPIELPSTINNPDSIQRFHAISPDGRKMYFNR